MGTDIKVVKNFLFFFAEKNFLLVLFSIVDTD